MDMTDAFAQPYVIDAKTGSLHVPSLKISFSNWGVRLYQDQEAAWSEVRSTVTKEISRRLMEMTYEEPLVKKDDTVVIPDLTSRIKFNILREMNNQGVTFRDLEDLWAQKYKNFTPRPGIKMDAGYFLWMFQNPNHRLDQVIDDIAGFLKVNTNFSLTSQLEESNPV